MHISPESTHSTLLRKASISGNTPPPPSAGDAGHVDSPSVPNHPPGPAAVADGLFLTSSVPRPLGESGDFDITPSGAGPQGILHWAPPYIARSPMRATPATPTRNPGGSSRPDGSASRLASAQASLRPGASATAVGSPPALHVPVVPAPGGAPAPSLPANVVPAIIIPLATPARIPTCSSASGAGPSTRHPPSASLRQLTLFELLDAAFERLPKLPCQDSQAEAPTPFLVSPGRPSHPIYIQSTDPTPNSTPAPAQRPADATNTTNTHSVQRHYVSVSVQTDTVYILSRLGTPEPDTARHGSNRNRRTRQQFEGDESPAAAPPPIRRRLDSSSPASSSSSVEGNIDSSPLSPPRERHFDSSPSPSPGPSLASTRIRRKRSSQPQFHVKVLTSSDEEYRCMRDYPQAQLPNVSTTPSMSAASASTSSVSAFANHPSDASEDEYPDLLDFNDPAIAEELTAALIEAAKELAQPQPNDKGKGVARS